MTFLATYSDKGIVRPINIDEDNELIQDLTRRFKSNLVEKESYFYLVFNKFENFVDLISSYYCYVTENGFIKASAPYEICFKNK